MDRYQYLLLMAGCLVLTLPLEFVLGARVYRRPLRLLAALVPTVALFVVWDVVGIIRDHWGYNPAFISGVHLGLMPLEELVFFVVIPICGLLTYEAVGSVVKAARLQPRPRTLRGWLAALDAAGLKPADA